MCIRDRLYIVPLAGGEARRLRANTSLMNSWHSFSPNGRWLVFSSKACSPYTQMYLTHLDEEGNSSPAILIDNSTAANRAVNLPEFINTAGDGIEDIGVPAVELYKLIDQATQLEEEGKNREAVSYTHLDVYKRQQFSQRTDLKTIHSRSDSAPTRIPFCEEMVRALSGVYISQS